MKYKLIIGLGAIITLLSIIFFSSPKKVSTHTITRGQAVKAVYATGTVEPTLMIAITPRISAPIRELFHDEGDVVKKGEVLAQLDDTEQKAKFSELKIREDLAKQEFERSERLFKNNAKSKEEFDRSKSEYFAIKASREAAEAVLQYVTITAPSDGRIVRRDGEIGELMTSQRSLFWLSADEHLRITAEVDEEDVSEIHPDQEVLIRADAFPNKVFNGKVSSITPKGDSVARSFRVRISLPLDIPLRIGMTAETNIILGKKENVLLTPTGSLMKNEVWTLQNGRAIKKNVEVGIQGSEFTEILNGLREGDIVITDSFNSLKDGKKVRG